MGSLRNDRAARRCSILSFSPSAELTSLIMISPQSTLLSCYSKKQKAPGQKGCILAGKDLIIYLCPNRLGDCYKLQASARRQKAPREESLYSKVFNLSSGVGYFCRAALVNLSLILA